MGVDDGVETWGVYMVVWVVHGGVGVFCGLYMVVWVFFLVFTCWMNCCVGVTQWHEHVVCVCVWWGGGGGKHVV